MRSSQEYYDGIASIYNDKLNKKDKYLKAVEHIIFDQVGDKPVQKYLDIGCGNGSRSIRIIDRLSPDYSCLIDESPEMIKGAYHLKSASVDVLKVDVNQYVNSVKFDLITCLWNVLGHLGSKQKVFKTLQKIHSILEYGGICIIDINNRYNIKEYGVISFLKNSLFDLFGINDRGKYRIGVGDTVTNVYIHNPFELDRYLEKNGFKILNKKYVNYSSGKYEQYFFQGQIVYVLQKMTANKEIGHV